MTTTAITREMVLQAMNKYGCTCTEQQLWALRGDHRIACPSLHLIQVKDIQPGTIVEIWGDRVNVDAPLVLAHDGCRLMLGDYSIQPTEHVKILGHFNA